jgi:hypothetical protein
MPLWGFPNRENRSIALCNSTLHLGLTAWLDEFELLEA